MAWPNLDNRLAGRCWSPSLSAWFDGLVVLVVIGRRSTPSARDILDERYARGEIDREEYLKRKQDIASGS